MAFRVKIADTPEELDALFQCRHRAFVLQDGWAPRPDGRVYDEFDAWPHPHCVNFVAQTLEGEIIGGMRLLVRPDGGGTSSEQLFDFEPHFQPGTVRASASMLCVDARYRAQAARLTNSLMSCFYHYALTTGVQELYGCIKHVLWPTCEVIGGKALAPIPQVHEGLKYVPFTFWMPKILQADRWGAFIRQHDLREFLGIWTRQFHEAGETIYRRGEDADEAFVVVQGEVEAHDERGPLLSFGRPYLFGEQEMLEGLSRRAEVVARTPVDLIVIDRATFFSQVAQQPAGAVRFARALLQEQAARPVGAPAPAPPSADALEADNGPEARWALAAQRRAAGDDLG